MKNKGFQETSLFFQQREETPKLALSRHPYPGFIQGFIHRFWG